MKHMEHWNAGLLTSYNDLDYVGLISVDMKNKSFPTINRKPSSRILSMCFYGLSLQFVELFLCLKQSLDRLEI